MTGAYALSSRILVTQIPLLAREIAEQMHSGRTSAGKKGSESERQSVRHRNEDGSPQQAQLQLGP